MTDAIANRLRELATGASLEMTPRHAGELSSLDGVLPAATPIYVTSLPGAPHDDLVTAAAAIRAAGHVPVPHLTARSIAGPAELDGLLGRLVAAAGVDDVLVVAGGLKQPAGEYTSSMDVLRSGLLERHGIARVGVAGHPEGSPDISSEAMWEALAAKNDFARSSQIHLRIVSQFALAGEPYVAWERQLRGHGNRLPVIAGIPGVTSPATLLKYALACGVGPSIEVLRKKSGGLLKLATTRAWRPDDVAATIAASTLEDPDSLIRGLHLFPFGGVERSAQWLAEVSAAAPVPAMNRERTTT
jgi:methylenetetrahydrofolate reductase (NADPH)